MSINTRRVAASPSSVYAVLADGWTYSSWVVGTARIRSVDAAWPKPGATIEHSVGAWPLLLHDRTIALGYEPNRRLVLQVRGWPLGEAEVEFTVEPAEPDPAHGEEAGCLVKLAETPRAGPVRKVFTPVIELALRRRNVETLNRLAALAERVTSPA